MIAKFLFGTAPCIPVGKEDTNVNLNLDDLLLIVRKHDIFQHIEMGKLCSLQASTGGFVKGIRHQGEENFYGESISCRVQTDGSMLPLYHELTKTGSWYKYEHMVNKSKFTIFACVKADYYPSGYWSNLKWEPCEYKDIRPTMIADCSTQ